MNFTSILEKLSEHNHLTTEESTYALKQIISGDITDVQVAAFLFGLRSKGETIDELTSFVQVMREAAISLDVDAKDAVDMCGTGGDHSGTFNISTAAMFVVAGSGIPVLKHGNRSISSKSGSFDVLTELGAVADLTPDKVKACFEQTKTAFMFAPNFHPAMKYVMPARRALGMRTFFNILGPLINPAGVKKQVIGAYNRNVAHTMIRILGNLDTESAITVHSHDGLDEVSTTTLTDTFELKHHVTASEPVVFDAAGLGYQRVSLEDLKGGDASINATIIRNIFMGSSTKAQRDIVELNAAFSIYISGVATTLDEAKQIAADSIDSGSALRSLKTFTECTTDLNLSL